MSNDVVRYNNGLNTIPLRNFTPVEMDIFWAVCSKMKRKGTQEMTFDFDVFKEIAKYDRREKEGFYLAIKATWDKMKHLNYQFEDSHYFEELLLFQRFAIDKENEKVIIQASERFEFILNSIGTNFTRFELENMTSLSSSYSKELYRQLMSHRDLKTRKGAWFVKVHEFKEILSIPSSYRMSHIDERILERAKNEFTTPDKNGNVIFSTFRVEKVKARKGNKISSFKIYFQESTCSKSIPLF
ncbi:replication initiation protein [Vagococcus sp. BWB3-3]|uniref:Replication initiation protein n=1 Tax=Vagococcus allomyrinae TaxID=2794353 RepID=A0A940PIM0_9ENTE|nr:replication initiation protein [Vagococcus allomyrinae]MBP1044628.1 replication initiation protein [Vagococcus allomyrinae]